MNRPRTATFLTGATATIVLTLPVTGHAASPGQAATPLPEPGATRPCFMVPARWNEALDGPVPRCLAGTSTSASTSASTANDSGADTADNPDRPWLVSS